MQDGRNRSYKIALKTVHSLPELESKTKGLANTPIWLIDIIKNQGRMFAINTLSTTTAARNSEKSFPFSSIEWSLAKWNIDEATEAAAASDSKNSLGIGH